MKKISHLAAATSIAFGLSILSGCGSIGPDMDGAWVTESMRDAMECQMGRVMVINGDKIVFGIAGQIVRSFEGLETKVNEDDVVVMHSDKATFEFELGESPDQMTLLSGPMVAEHHTSRMPKDLARC